MVPTVAAPPPSRVRRLVQYPGPVTRAPATAPSFQRLRAERPVLLGLALGVVLGLLWGLLAGWTVGVIVGVVWFGAFVAIAARSRQARRPGAAR